MTIYWRGRGIIAVIIPFVLILMPTFIGKDNQIVTAIMGMLAGMIVFGLGKRLNAHKQNFEPGQNELSTIIDIPKHSLFWVAMEYWGLLFLFFGLASLINELLALNYLDLIHGICVVGLLTMMIVNRRREKKYLKRIEGKANENVVKDESRYKNRLTKKSNIALSKDSNKSETNKNAVKENSEKQKLYEELRNNRNKEVIFKPTNHKHYMPKQNVKGDDA